MPPADDLFRDALFAPPAVPIKRRMAMALSAAMRFCRETRLRRAPAGVDRRQWLVGTLYRRGDLP